VAVLTYRRPADLAEALPPLVEQIRSVTNGRTSADIVVVDNDPSASARELVTRFAAEADAEVGYQHEPTPGIAAARNRALRMSTDADLLVFIDDDERPSTCWLGLLLETYARHRPAAVVGPVVSEFAEEPEAWITAGRFFIRMRRPTGTPVEVAATNNLLLDLRQVRRLGLEFDTEFGLSGGSDTLFTRQLHRRGGELIWCDEAIVTDVVPASRSTRSWVLRRALRMGNTWSRTSVALAGSPLRRVAVRVRLSAAGVARIAVGLARMLLGMASRSQGRRACGHRILARGAGLLTGAWGYVYSEYKRH
jgi:succinoglycan biosynthesis protein ExoM